VIDKMLVRGEGAFRTIADRFGLSATALKRHKAEHLPRALVQDQQERESARGDDLLGEARRLKEVTMGLLGRAVQANDLRTAIMAVREARGNLELVGKLLGDLSDQPQVTISLLGSPEWIALRSVLISVLCDFPEAEAAVLARLQSFELEDGTTGKQAS
jgi:hypothetical protein